MSLTQLVLDGPLAVLSLVRPGGNRISFEMRCLGDMLKTNVPSPRHRIAIYCSHNPAPPKGRPMGSCASRVLYPLACLTMAACGGYGALAVGSLPKADPPSRVDQSALIPASRFTALHNLDFVENRGQWNSSVLSALLDRFQLARRGGRLFRLSAFVTSRE